MTCSSLVLIASLALASTPLAPGDHTRSVPVGEQSRAYLLHVPPSYDPRKPTPLVLALHPFATNGPLMARISGLSETADREGFLVAYPNGTGRGAMLRWNVGVRAGEDDNVAPLVKVLDDVAAVANVDPKRVYATGFSNGGMMCYRLAAECSDRIAAIAPVAGTMTAAEVDTRRPVSVLHFQGTKDTFVSYDGRPRGERRAFRLQGVEESVTYWAKRNDRASRATCRRGCPERPGHAASEPAVPPGTEGSQDRGTATRPILRRISVPSAEGVDAVHVKPRADSRTGEDIHCDLAVGAEDGNVVAVRCADEPRGRAVENHHCAGQLIGPREVGQDETVVGEHHVQDRAVGQMDVGELNIHGSISLRRVEREDGRPARANVARPGLG